MCQLVEPVLLIGTKEYANLNVWPKGEMLAWPFIIALANYFRSFSAVICLSQDVIGFSITGDRQTHRKHSRLHHKRSGNLGGNICSLQSGGHRRFSTKSRGKLHKGFNQNMVLPIFPLDPKNILLRIFMAIRTSLKNPPNGPLLYVCF